MISQPSDEIPSLQSAKPQPFSSKYSPNLNLSIRDSNQISFNFNLTRDSSKASTTVSTSGSSPLIISPFENGPQTIFNFQIYSQGLDLDLGPDYSHSLHHSHHLHQEQISSYSSPSQGLIDSQISLTSPQKTQFSCLNMNSKKITKTHENRSEEVISKKKRSGWSLQEDDLVLQLVKKYGTKWSAISAFIQGRTNKQIRDRYLHVLSASIMKIKWMKAEDQLLLSMYKEIGPQWTRISEFLEARTGLQVKNRFHTYLKKKEEMSESQVSEIGFEDGFIKENFMDAFNASEILFDLNENS